MMLFLYLPIIIGAVMLIFAKPLGTAFCRSGRANWRMLTFGLTGLGRLYNEKRTPITMRIVGAGFLLFGIVFLYEAGFPFKGPNRFKATIEAKEYLTNVYGSPGHTRRLSPERESTDDSVVIVNYQFGDHSGSLRGKWKGDKFEFSEIEKR
jgi:hypothetical protein